MTDTQTVALWLTYAAVPSATLFPILYSTTAPWWRSLIGWAVMTAKVGLALLVDASALFHFLGPNYRHRDQVVVTAFGVVVVGSWLYLVAYLRVQLLKRRRH